MFLTRNLIGVIICGSLSFAMHKLHEMAVQKGNYHQSKFYKTKETIWGWLFYVFIILTAIFVLGVFENID